MQFVYIDESGTGDEPIAVMTGVIADSYRMRPTKAEWISLLGQLSEIIGRDIDEIHTRDFYSGNSPWRDLNGLQRSQIIDAIFGWLHERRHSIVYSAINKEAFFNDIQSNDRLAELSTPWRFMAMHIALSLQKRFQGTAKNKRERKINPKGSTVLIFDHEHREQQRYVDMLLAPPDWTDSYYNRLERQEKMSQIIDVPHFVDSKQVGLIQLADFMCFFLRKHIELQMGFSEPAYPNEVEKVGQWTEMFLSRSIPKSNIFMNRNRCECSELFHQYAPEIIR